MPDEPLRLGDADRLAAEGIRGHRVDHSARYLSRSAALGSSLPRTERAKAARALAVQAGEGVEKEDGPAPLPREIQTNYGVGPRSTPLLTATRIFTVGINGTLLCLDRAKGGLNVPVGGKGQALIAFRQEDGAVAWKTGDFGSAPSSPSLIELGGKTQIVSLLNGFVAGFDPLTGRNLWKHPHGGRGAGPGPGPGREGQSRSREPVAAGPDRSLAHPTARRSDLDCSLGVGAAGLRPHEKRADRPRSPLNDRAQDLGAGAFIR